MVGRHRTDFVFVIGADLPGAVGANVPIGKGSVVDPGAAVTKPPPPVKLLQVAVSRIYATESQPSVIFQSDSVSDIFNDWRRLSLYY